MVVEKGNVDVGKCWHANTWSEPREDTLESPPSSDKLLALLYLHRATELIITMPLNARLTQSLLSPIPPIPTQSSQSTLHLYSPETVPITIPTTCAPPIPSHHYLSGGHILSHLSADLTGVRSINSIILCVIVVELGQRRPERSSITDEFGLTTPISVFGRRRDLLDQSYVSVREGIKRWGVKS